jgi:hypothetical protein
VTPSSGVNLQADQTYNLIQFGSTYSGTFSSINTLDFVGYKLTAIYGASDLSFKVQWLSLLPRATNSNQSSAASALDQLVPSAGPDLRGIISGISNASNALSASALLFCTATRATSASTRRRLLSPSRKRAQQAQRADGAAAAVGVRRPQ